ncbi:MAG: diguanylate cyclase [Gammaproteobacteria bacterium]|nr:diguanylate cyclase [Gammaproteobacteria bacterium]
MYIHELLAQSERIDIQFIQLGKTLREMAAVLCKHNIGSLLVINDQEDLIGILSERDLVRAVNNFPRDVADRLVSEIMTRSVITCCGDDDVVETLDVMNRNGIRHIPVVENKRPIAVLSIREFDFVCKSLQTIARTDELTGLPNRRHFMESLESELSRYGRFESTFCVAMFDIDKFKPINDTYGHNAGDQVLRALAQILAGELRAYDTVGRLGGEEFGIIFPNTVLTGAVKACDHVANAFRAGKVVTDKGLIRFTVSFGVTEVDSEVPDCTTVLKQADKYLYEAKAAGRDRTVAGPLVTSTIETAGSPKEPLSVIQT